MLKENDENFEPWEGLISRSILWDKEAEIATVIYLCETLESVEKAKKHVHSEREKYEELLDYWTELNAKVLKYKLFK